VTGDNLVVGELCLYTITATIPKAIPGGGGI